MRPLIGSVLIAGLASSALPAQIVEPGTVIRAERNGNEARLIGTLVARTPDTLTMAPRGGGLVKIPAATLSSIEVANGRRRFVPALKWAAISGAVWGAIASTLPYEPCDPARYSNCNESNSMTKSEFVLAQFVGIGAIMGAVGAIRGDDRWTRVEGRAVSAVVAPSRNGATAGFRLQM